MKIVTNFRGSEGYGWSEVHYRFSSSDTPDLKAQLANYLTNVAPARQVLLGEDCKIIGARISYPRAGAVASYAEKYSLPGTEGMSGAASALSLAINFKDSTFTKSKVVHLRGFWDAIEFNEAYHPDNAPGWLTALTAWKDALIANEYGWPTKDPAASAKGQVTNYVALAEGQVKFTLANVVGTLPAVGTVFQCAFSKINKSESVLNGTFLVERTGASELTTVQQIGVGPFQSKGKFNYRAVAFTKYSATAAISIGKRQMGKSPALTPGRSRARRRY